MKIKNLGHWVTDYLYALHKHSLVFVYRKPPAHYLGYSVEGKKPIVIIPGVLEKWHFMKVIADPLSRLGHPVYILPHLGYNTESVDRTTRTVRELIDERKLENVIIIAHSKGGLIGKYLLQYHNSDNKVEKVIAIASPFGGSDIVKFLPSEVLKELSPQSKVITDLSKKTEVNSKIISIFGKFDNHVWPNESCHLEGAKNIQVNAYGHHKILESSEVREAINSEVR